MDYEHFYPELGSIFPGYPWLAFDRALNISARTLCRLGLVWRTETDPIDWVTGCERYALPIPEASYIVQVLDAAGMTPTTPQQLTYRDSGWRTRSGAPTHYYLDKVTCELATSVDSNACVGVVVPPALRNAVRVYPVPGMDRRDAVVFRLAVAPTPDAPALDDDYALAHERLLLIGAVANLGKASWAEFEHACHGVRSFSTDERQIGVSRKVRYGGL